MDNLASMLFHVESKNGVYLDRIVVGSMRQYPHRTLFCFASCHQRDWRIIIKIINNYYYYRVYNYNNITIVVAAKLQQNYNNIFFSSSPVEEVPPSLPLRRPTACILSCGETDLQQRVDTLRLLASRVGSSISSFSSVVPSFCAS